MRKLTYEEANAPRPKPPDMCRWRVEWQYYFSDLACWKATQAERYLSGIEDRIPNAK